MGKSRILLVVVVMALSLPITAMLAVGLIMFGSPTPSQLSECRPTHAAVTTSWTIPIGEDYRVTSSFGRRVSPIDRAREVHTGIDLASYSNRAPVLAAASGEVTRVENLGSRSYGLWVEIDHGNGTTTRYAHLRSVSVAVGDLVGTGQQIAVEGASGGVTGPHLHFEIRVQGSARNPVGEMETRGLVFDGTAGTPTSTSNAAAAVSAETMAEILPNPAGVDRSSTLTAEQRATAAAIVEEGQAMGLGPRAWAIALMTALQESTLGAHPSIDTPNSDGDVGVFQQRSKVGWYADGATMAENVAILNDVRYAARTFYGGHRVQVQATGAAGPVGYQIPGLVDIPGWESLPLWTAAQRVQRSAYPLRYASHEATVAALLPALTINASSYECPTGAAIDPNASIGEQVVAHALTQLGVPYSWNGGDANGPTTGTCCSPGGKSGAGIIGFDCSGLTLWAWAQVGVRLPHQSGAQERLVNPVAVDDIRAGDLLFFPGHVGIADGNGGMIEAPRPGVPVRVTPNVLEDSYYGPRFTGAGRPTLPAQPDA